MVKGKRRKKKLETGTKTKKIQVMIIRILKNDLNKLYKRHRGVVRNEMMIITMPVHSTSGLVSTRAKNVHRKISPIITSIT